MKRESARYIVVGNVDAGKSTLISVLENKVLDNGNGSARSLIIRLKHEKVTGQTSNHSHRYIIDSNNYITTLIDLCGHERYLKTTLFGVTGLFADYGLMIIGANRGIVDMALEHLRLLISNRMPFIIILTKMDIVPDAILAALRKNIERMANANKKNVVYLEADTKSELVTEITSKFQARNAETIPVIQISNKTGLNIDFLRNFITNIRKPTLDVSTSNILSQIPNITLPLIVYLDAAYSVNGVGTVLSGVVKYGEINLGDEVYLGPFHNDYLPVTIKSMHNCIRESITTLRDHEAGTFGIRVGKNMYTRKSFSKGQILSNDLAFVKAHTCYTFDCDLIVFSHPTTITNGYQTVIHCGTSRQTARFIMAPDAVLRINCRSTVTVKFMWYAEFILPGMRFMFRDGKTKGMGLIKSTRDITEDLPGYLTRREIEKAKLRVRIHEISNQVIAN